MKEIYITSSGVRGVISETRAGFRLDIINAYKIKMFSREYSSREAARRAARRELGSILYKTNK